MMHRVETLIKEASSCTCGNVHHPIEIDELFVGQHALVRAVHYLLSRCWQRTIIVADEQTHAAAGRLLLARLQDAGIKAQAGLVDGNGQGDVIADEATLVQAMLHVPKDADVILAVGSGTIHDIVRFVSYKMNKPFISIPTAPSVDGFNSVGAPLIIRGFKRTYILHSPVAVFADLDILMRAPKPMIAAGFGDMLGKFTSLADWAISHRLGGEPYCPAVQQTTTEALQMCVDVVDAIASGSQDGVATLMEALILSGLAMLVFGQSHPASGAEHHLSHYWEMDSLKRGKKQLLHGAKVGVACRIIAEQYKYRFKETVAVSSLGPDMEAVIAQIPEPVQIEAWLKKVGGPATPGELGLSEELVARSLHEAHTLRDRHTLLRWVNERKTGGRHSDLW